MLGIGGTEFAIILLFAFLIFGPDKLPAIAKTLGQAIAKFREVQGEMNQVVKEEIYDPEKDGDNPFQKPLDKMAQIDNRPAKTETFAERKARHDRERQERLAARTQAAQEAAASANAVEAGAPAAAAPAETAAPAASDNAGEEPVAAKPRPKMSAAELYGMAPAATAKKPAPSAGSPAEGGE